MDKIKPKLIIFAGANGAGKTTVAKLLLPKRRIKEFVNADEIARGLSPLNPTGQAVAAGRLVSQRIDELIAKRQSFAIETTLSGRAQYRKLQNAKVCGFAIEMHYIFCADINLNIRRVKLRASQGGHDVPAPDIRRRYWRSLKHFATPYDEVCDIITVYDTTDGDPIEIAQKKQDEEFIRIFDPERGNRFIEKITEALNDR